MKDLLLYHASWVVPFGNYLTRQGVDLRGYAAGARISPALFESGAEWIPKQPIDPSIPYHSIMGDRGKGDTPDSSDGVVAYWSSHLDGAESERIVPSNHSAHQHKEGIEEVRRILLLHAGSR